MARSPFGTLASRVLATAFTVVVFVVPAAAQTLPSGDANGGLMRATDIARLPSSSPDQTLDPTPDPTPDLTPDPTRGQTLDPG
jgi:hypothetical protein